jgi:hypothetical protein
MPNLVDMRLSEEEKKDFSTPRQGPEAPKFPFGLRLRLGPDELKKLGFLSAPKVDDKLLLLGKSMVIEVAKRTEDEMKLGELDFSVELQITELSVKGEEERPKSPSQVIYGEDS